MIRRAYKFAIFFLVLMLTGVFGLARSTFASWTPPIGVPAPSFGIEESYRMYDIVENRNGALTYSPGTSGGFYTHYVDRTNPSATDTANAYGTSAKPRLTIPSSLPAGSVLEIHGVYDYAPSGYDDIISQGNPAMPVFVRGVNSGMTRQIVLRGTYLIAEYLVFRDQDGDLSGGNTGKLIISISASNPIDTHHISVRNNDISGNKADAGGGISVTSSNGSYRVTDVVFYNNNIHDNGDYQIVADQDVHGITVNQLVSRLWIVDNVMGHNSGNSVQVNGGSSNDNIDHVYIGRNTNSGMPNRQAFIGVKQSRDVVISENNIWFDELPAGAAPSRNVGLVYQYGPERLWVISNTIHDARFGISSGSNSVPNPGNDTYIIGNLIYNIAPAPDETYNPNTPWSGAGIMLAGGVNRHVIGNTLHNVVAGINVPGAGVFNIKNNIISQLTRPDTYHIWLESRLSTLDSVFYNNILHQNDGPARMRWGDMTVAGDVATFESLAGGAAQYNLELSPLFTTVSGNSFTIQASSPAINAGIASDVYNTFFSLYGIDIKKDLAGTTRPQGAAWDLGAYEFVPTGDAMPPANPTGLSVT